MGTPFNNAIDADHAISAGDSRHRARPGLIVATEVHPFWSWSFLPSLSTLAHTLSLCPKTLYKESEALVAGPIAQLGVEVESRGRQSAHCRAGGTERKRGEGAHSSAVAIVCQNVKLETFPLKLATFARPAPAFLYIPSSKLQCTS
jgi:hypothetical protein